MNLRIACPVLLLCLFTFLAGCQDEPRGDLVAPAAEHPSSGPLNKLTGEGEDEGGDTSQQEALDWIYQQGESFTYETVISIEYTPGVAAQASGFASTWGPLLPFFMYVPAGALLPEDISGETILLEMRVPVFETEFACADAPMPIEFAPHGTDFREPIIVSLSQHPALEASCTGYTLYYVEEEPGGMYSYGGVQTSGAEQEQASKAAPIKLDPIDPDPEPFQCKTGIFAFVDHFSRWNLSQGGGGGGGSPPIFVIPCP